MRFARVVALEVAHHITQRGNARRFILEPDAERGVYLDLLHQGRLRHGVALIGYCLMSNRVHLVAVPQSKDALARSLKQTHGRFAAYWNALKRSSGHVWQGRYYSCPLDDDHLWEALRYTELNPVRASLVASAEDWTWSSAAAHCGAKPVGARLSMGGSGGLSASGAPTCRPRSTRHEASRKAIRDSTYSGRPLGSPEFTRALERQEHRPLTRQKPGPKKRSVSGQEQALLSFDPL